MYLKWNIIQVCGLCKHSHSAIFPYKHHIPVTWLLPSAHAKPHLKIWHFLMIASKRYLHIHTTNISGVILHQKLVVKISAHFIHQSSFEITSRTDVHFKLPPTMVYFVCGNKLSPVCHRGSFSQLKAGVLYTACQSVDTNSDVREVLRHYWRQY